MLRLGTEPEHSLSHANTLVHQLSHRIARFLEKRGFVLPIPFAMYPSRQHMPSAVRALATLQGRF